MGLLSRAEGIVGDINVDGTNVVGDASHHTSRKLKATKKNLSLLKKKIAEYQKIYRVFGCVLFEDRAYEKGKTDFFEKLTTITGDLGTTNPINHGFALVLFPTEMDRELMAHRLSKSLNAEPVLSFRAANPEYVISRIHSM